MRVSNFNLRPIPHCVRKRSFRGHLASFVNCLFQKNLAFPFLSFPSVSPRVLRMQIREEFSNIRLFEDRASSYTELWPNWSREPNFLIFGRFNLYGKIAPAFYGREFSWHENRGLIKGRLNFSKQNVKKWEGPLGLEPTPSYMCVGVPFSWLVTDPIIFQWPCYIFGSSCYIYDGRYCPLYIKEDNATGTCCTRISRSKLRRFRYQGCRNVGPRGVRTRDRFFRIFPDGGTTFAWKKDSRSRYAR